jgi:predicted RNA binding protein YcfA (HicA-like mRNA interferase family)
MKVREALRLLKDDGWVDVATCGSHMQFKHPTNLAGSPSRATLTTTLHLGR